MKQTKDVDYIFLSTRVKAMERNLLTKDRITQMLEAPTNKDAAKVIVDCGYPEMTEITNSELNRVLAEQQQDMIADLGSCTPSQYIVDVFKLRYDYHNAKVLVKAESMGANHNHLLMSGGRYDCHHLADAFQREEMFAYSDLFRHGIARAREILGSTGDPQQVDFILDRAYFEELTSLSHASGSKFLRDYAALAVDTANLRAYVRAVRLGRSTDFLRHVLLPGGTVSIRNLASARGEDLIRLFHGSRLSAAAAEGAAKSAPNSGTLTEFERLCDNAVMDYFRDARRVSFGVEPILGYLYARESDATTIRIIMSGRMAGLDTETIWERLRECYV